MRSVWAALALAAGAGPGDLGVRLDRFPTAMTLPAVEALLSDPVSGRETALSWGERLEAQRGLAAPLGLAADLLGAPASPAPAVSAAACAEAPEALRGPAGRLAAAADSAAAAALRASSSYNEAERASLLASFGGVLRRAPLARVDASAAALAARFDAGALIRAGAALAAAVEAELPALRAAAAGGPRGAWRCGSAAVFGVQDDAHGQDLAGASVSIDLGGDNSYKGAAAAAGPGQARVVVDLGARLVFESTGPAFGSGVFGIGLLYAPEPGPKYMEAGDVSFGAGLFGVGAALIEGPEAAARGGRFSQGAGAFGAGVFSVSGAATALSADFAAQGFGATRGAGLLLARGDDARLDCGLRHPDPREALAFISMCQGAGDGPRGHAAGGLGLALVAGDKARLRSSYFAQGAGYWHSFGGLYVRGDGVSAEARRYAQGAGVHAASGLLSWRGSSGRAAVWGAGPALGWDYGVGHLEVRGARNAFQSDWAGARGDVNGRSFVDVEGDGNRLRVNDWATATYRRLAPGYALARVAGDGNRLWTPGLARERAGAFDVASTLWGVTRGEGRLVLSADVSSSPVNWPIPDRSADGAAEGEAMRRALAEAEGLPLAGRVERWLTLASAFSLDAAGPRSAAARLMSLPASSAAVVVPQLRVEDFDASLWIRLSAAASGQGAGRIAQAQLARARGLRRAWFADLLRFGPAPSVLGAAKTLLGDEDWKCRRAGAALLGAAFGDQAGDEPGRLRLLEESSSLARSTFTRESVEEAAAFARLGAQRAADVLAVLALDPALAAETKLALLAAGDPFDTVKPPALRVFVDALRAKPALYAPAVARELAQAGAAMPKARILLREAAADRDPEVRAAALAALGQAGAAKDAPLLGRALDDEAIAAREAAAKGLADLGEDGRAEIEAALSGGTPRARRAAVLAAARSADAATAALLRRALADADAAVRKAAVAALAESPAGRRAADLEAAAPLLRAMAQGDPDPSAAASAARVLGQSGR